MARLENRIRIEEKLCNEYYLGGRCYFISTCKVGCSDIFQLSRTMYFLATGLPKDAVNGMPQYEHDPTVDREEIKALAFTARRTLCKRGSGCRGIMCYYGHICPDEPNCPRGSMCTFEQLHGMDTNPVKMVGFD